MNVRARECPEKALDGTVIEGGEADVQWDEASEQWRSKRTN